MGLRWEGSHTMCPFLSFDKSMHYFENEVIMIKFIFKKKPGGFCRGLLEYGAVQRGPADPRMAACPHRKAFPAGTGLPIRPEPKRRKSAHSGSRGPSL